MSEGQQHVRSRRRVVAGAQFNLGERAAGLRLPVDGRVGVVAHPHLHAHPQARICAACTGGLCLGASPRAPKWYNCVHRRDITHYVIKPPHSMPF